MSTHTTRPHRISRKRPAQHWLPPTLCLLLSLSLLSCMSPAPPSGFLKNHQVMARNKQLPYLLSWQAPQAKLSSYRHIHIAPVDTSHLMMTKRMANHERVLNDHYPADIQKLAGHFHQALHTAFRTHGERAWHLTNTPRAHPHTLVVETSLVEVVPSRVWLEPIGFFIPGPFPTIFNQPRIAIEARLKDARTGQTLFRMADREKAPFSIQDFGDFQWYRIPRRELNHWAKQLVQTIERQPGEKIRDTFPFKPINF